MTERAIRVLFLCLGNICRSPLAEGVFRARVVERGIDHRFEIDSAGTSAYHAGERPDPGSVRIAAAHGIDITGQRSRPLTAADLAYYDFVIPMDRRNLYSIQGALPPERAVLARAFDPHAVEDFDVPDPWGGGDGGFQAVFEMLDRCVDGLVAHMLHHGPRG